MPEMTEASEVQDRMGLVERVVYKAGDSDDDGHHWIDSSSSLHDGINHRRRGIGVYRRPHLLLVRNTS